MQPSTEECTKYDKNFYKDKKPETKNKYCNLIREPKSSLKNISIESTVNGNHVDLLLDTGTERNYIKKTKAIELNLKIREGHSITNVYANGELENNDKYVEAKLLIKGMKKPMETEFYLLKNLPEKLLIGSDFMLNHEMIIDCKNKAVIINNTVAGMIGRESLLEDDIDQILYERICLIKDKDKLEGTELMTEIMNYVKDNESFEHLKLDPIKIFYDEKINSEEIRFKHYPVPIKYEKGAREEI